jgi:hypothetical protein
VSRLRTAPALALAALAIGAGAVGTAGWGETRADGRAARVTDSDGDVLALVELTGDRFAVRYRNSLYGTLAEERYTVTSGGRFTLEELAADQLAVLEEYYALPSPPRPAPDSDRRAFVAPPHPERAPTFDELSIAATDLGERTLLVPGSEPVDLWRLVDDGDPTVVLQVGGVR